MSAQSQSGSGTVTAARQPAGRSTRFIAVLGTGSIGMRHLEILRQLQGVQPVAVPIRPERCSELANAGYTTASSVEAAIHQGATLCIVSTETGRHVQDSLDALQAGIDVLVEKPMAVDARDAAHLHRRAREMNRLVVVGCVLRFSQSLNTFRELLPTIGQLHDVRIECQSSVLDWRPDQRFRQSYAADARQGGVLRDLIHEIDYAGWLLGWPDTLQAQVSNLGRLGIEADESADLLWRTRDGATVSIHLDYLTRPARRGMRAAGEHGTVAWDGITGVVTRSLHGKSTEMIESTQTRDQMFTAQASAFISASQDRSPHTLATSEDGVKALAVCDAARLASERRGEVEVQYG